MHPLLGQGPCPYKRHSREEGKTPPGAAGFCVSGHARAGRRALQVSGSLGDQFLQAPVHQLSYPDFVF